MIFSMTVKNLLNFLEYMNPFRHRLLQLLEECDYERKELVQITGVAPSTVHDNLFVLIQRGLVKKYSENLPGRARGRPKVIFLRTETPYEFDSSLESSLSLEGTLTLDTSQKMVAGEGTI
jgi:predicted ArsR family transcriptional regulator